MLTFFHQLRRAMKLHQIRSFVATIDEGGIRAAARSAGLSQVAVAKQLRELEAVVGRQLFTRTPSGTRPTAAALQLLPEARLLLEQAHRFSSALVARGQQHLALAINPAISLLLLGSVLPGFSRLRPDIKLRLHEGMLTTSLAKLRDGSIELAIVAADAQSIPADLSFAPFVNTRSAFLARKGHPLLGTRTSLKELRTFPWVQNEAPGGYSDRLRRWFDELGVEPPAFIACDSFVTAMSVVQATDCLVCTPLALMEHPSVSGVFARVEADTEPPRSTIGFLTRRGEPLSQAADDFRMAIHRSCCKLAHAILL